MAFLHAFRWNIEIFLSEKNSENNKTDIVIEWIYIIFAIFTVSQIWILAILGFY